MMAEEILQPLTTYEISKLLKIYEKGLPKATYIYTYLTCVINWKAKWHHRNNYITLYAPRGNWQKGTFIGIHKFYCYELIMFTLEEENLLQEALINTKIINWNHGLLLYAIYNDHISLVSNALKQTTFKFYNSDVCDIMWMPKEKALKLEVTCPDEVYVAKLNPSHAATVNSNWLYKYPESEEYIKVMIEMNGGYGIFLKSNGLMVAWILRNVIGLSALQTLIEYRNKGYGSLVTKVMTKEIASDGLDPLGSVVGNNSISQMMFKKIGFTVLEKVMYAENVEKRK